MDWKTIFKVNWLIRQIAVGAMLAVVFTLQAADETGSASEPDRALITLFLENPESVVLSSQPADQIFKRAGYRIGYCGKNRQAEWVYYILRKDQLGMPQFKRKDHFAADPDVKNHPVQPREYRKTGYDKGHLAPAADMSYAEVPLLESFYMSNISPQLPGCNRGIWKRLEMEIRGWAREEGYLLIITGPVFYPEQQPQNMKGTDIPIPPAFFKIVLDLTPPMKMIGFVIPNQTSKKRVAAFCLSVDEIEALTGSDFFKGMPHDQEEALEKQCDFSEWKRKKAEKVRLSR